METGVFERRSARKLSRKIISPTLYNLTMGLVLLWGFGLNVVLVNSLPVSSLLEIPPLVFFIGYFASCFYGIHLFKTSTNPWVSFLGFNFVVIPFGLVLNIIVSHYDPNIVAESFRITAIITAIMMALGTAFPDFFKNIRWALTIALLAVVVVELVEVFIFKIESGIIDWTVALIFCGYVGYDWGRANLIPKTLDNAIDSAAALYMDIVNLFVRILRALGRRRR
jgi:FtsH-binding integral membrane protein